MLDEDLGVGGVGLVEVEMMRGEGVKEEVVKLVFVGKVVEGGG